MADEKENGNQTALIVLGLAGLGVIVTAMVLVYKMAKQTAMGGGWVSPELAPQSGGVTLLGGDQLALPAPRGGQTMAGAKTYSVQSDSPVRIATGRRRPTVVTMRAIHPPGQWAAVTTSMAIAREASATYPTGDLIVVPVGGAPQGITLQPGEALFAKASQDNVLLSVSTEEL